MWLQRNCPTAPIPRLYGVGFPGAHSFTLLENEKWHNRILWHWRNFKSWLLSEETLTPYFTHSRRELLEEVGYLLIEHVDEGKMLSQSWKLRRNNPAKRANLYRDLSRIMLSLAQLPLPHIGSWTVDNHGILSLTNRPLSMQLHQSENQNIPTDIPRDATYSSVEPYLLDLLACHDNRIRHQPNSMQHQSDGELCLAALTAMRALLPVLTNRRFRNGPFVVTLTDLRQGGGGRRRLFRGRAPRPTYDSTGNQTHQPPTLDHDIPGCEGKHRPWLSNPGITDQSTLGPNGIANDGHDEYAKAYEEFMEAFQLEELALLDKEPTLSDRIVGLSDKKSLQTDKRMTLSDDVNTYTNTYTNTTLIRQESQKAHFGDSLNRLLGGGGTQFRVAFSLPPAPGPEGQDRDKATWKAHLLRTDEYKASSCDLVMRVRRPTRFDPGHNVRNEPIRAYGDLNAFLVDKNKVIKKVHLKFDDGATVAERRVNAANMAFAQDGASGVNHYRKWRPYPPAQARGGRPKALGSWLGLHNGQHGPHGPDHDQLCGGPCTRSPQCQISRLGGCGQLRVVGLNMPLRDADVGGFIYLDEVRKIFAAAEEGKGTEEDDTLLPSAQVSLGMGEPSIGVLASTLLFPEAGEKGHVSKIHLSRSLTCSHHRAGAEEVEEEDARGVYKGAQGVHGRPTLTKRNYALTRSERTLRQYLWRKLVEDALFRKGRPDGYEPGSPTTYLKNPGHGRNIPRSPIPNTIPRQTIRDEPSTLDLVSPTQIKTPPYQGLTEYENGGCWPGASEDAPRQKFWYLQVENMESLKEFIEHSGHPGSVCRKVDNKIRKAQIKLLRSCAVSAEDLTFLSDLIKLAGMAYGRANANLESPDDNWEMAFKEALLRYGTCVLGAFLGSIPFTCVRACSRAITVIPTVFIITGCQFPRHTVYKVRRCVVDLSPTTTIITTAATLIPNRWCKRPPSSSPRLPAAAAPVHGPAAELILDIAGQADMATISNLMATCQTMNCIISSYKQSLLAEKISQHYGSLSRPSFGSAVFLTAAPVGQRFTLPPNSFALMRELDRRDRRIEELFIDTSPNIHSRTRALAPMRAHTTSTLESTWADKRRGVM
ncbi:hypothetical protein QBC46DRAFT_446785 [Diplogelasinospora grovesii]|uniref:Uncharacterized protein n=1 Tax=Diplogelasinospora grovesii TaxID=303347 RepID=A0AAN6S7W8_9PEZI|nr:hypothetical protein QBC46DRAFT_446785 [Diplogelasinospora grovesii]